MNQRFVAAHVKASRCVIARRTAALMFAPLVLLVSAPPDLTAWGAEEQGNMHDLERSWEERIRAAEGHMQGGRLTQAEAELSAGLTIAERFPPGNFRLAITLNNLGSVLRGQGKLAESEQLFRRAVGLLRSCHSEACQTALTSATRNLALVCIQKGRLFEAERLLKESLRLCESLRASPVMVRSVLEVLATIELYRKNPGGAEVYLRRGLEIPGERSIDASRLTLLAPLVVALSLMGRRDAARNLLAEVTSPAALNELVGASTPAERYAIADNLCMLATSSAADGDLQSAAALLTRAEPLLPRGEWQSTPVLGTFLIANAQLRWREKNYDAAEELIRKALPVLASHFAPDHPEILFAKATYAATLRKLRRKDEAKRIEDQIRELRRTSIPDFGSHSVSFHDLQRRP